MSYEIAMTTLQVGYEFTLFQMRVFYEMLDELFDVRSVVNLHHYHGNSNIESYQHYR